MHALEHKVPPPVVAVIVGLLMWRASLAAHLSHFTLPGHTYIASAVALAGLLVDLSALYSFRRQKTTINPLTPSATSSLVITGLYRFTRNPMYLGLLLVLTGWAFVLSNVVAFALLPVFILYIDRFQIEPEERALALKFGPEFLAYQSKVRRWL